MRADLHLHTVASDGSLRAYDVVKWAEKSGLELIAITDHDTVNGLDEAFDTACSANLKVIAGIELSTFSNCEIHILGYNFDYKNPEFVQELEIIKDFRKTRNIKIGEKLRELGLNVRADFAAEGLGRMNIARAMEAQGLVRDTNEAFEKYLGVSGRAYVRSKRLTPIEAVKLIKKYGGFASVAHPKKYLLDKRLEMLVSGLKQFGLDGLEIFYPSHTDKDIEELSGLAARNRLLPTGGSDFHGDEDKNFVFELDKKTLRALLKY